MNIQPLLKRIQESHSKKTTAIKNLRQNQARLKRSGIDYGTPNYKEGKYLRIIRSATGGKPREFTYIGSDPKKQKAALDALDRGHKYSELDKEIRELQVSLFSIESGLQEINY